MRYKKTYVTVDVRYQPDGHLRPLSILWLFPDGLEKRYPIDRVLWEKPRPSMKVGGQGILYLCTIGGKEKRLFFEEPRWFVEEPLSEEPT